MEDDFRLLEDSVTSKNVRWSLDVFGFAAITLEATVVYVFVLLVVAVVVAVDSCCSYYSIVSIFVSLVRKSILVKSGRNFPEIC